MSIAQVFLQLGIALGLGALVGLQRERVESRLAGIRTFPLITVFGSICGLIAQTFGGWVIAAGFLAMAATIVIGDLIRLKKEDGEHLDPGLTTEIAMLLMFALGVYLTVGHKEIAIAIGGGAAVLLQFKNQMHAVVAKLGEEDLKAIMQFALISLVILPVLPDATYDRFSVINPRQIWYMVVLIVGISLGGYIVYKFFGKNAGIVLGGILGGTISSTATTVSFSRRTKAAPATSLTATIVIMIASSVVLVRVMLEIAVISLAFFKQAILPLAILLLLLAALSLGLWFWGQKQETEMPPQENPSELKSALFFGLIYALVLFAVAAAKARFGDRGLYIVAALSGLTDVDAITLSTAHLVDGERLDGDTGWKVVLVALLSNLVFKAGAAALLGSRLLLKKLGSFYAVVLVVGILILLMW
ncbi:MAG: DUF4010 domain-containing protein [Acidobacteriota bacterium]